MNPSGIPGRFSPGTTLLAFFAGLLLNGCSTPPTATRPANAPDACRPVYSADPSVNAAHLANCLGGLSPSVDPTEAALAAETACACAWQLRQEYRVVGTPWFHNMLVNVGIRKRGLCYQWADDLTASLEALQLRTLVLSRAVARLGTRHEHSGVVLTAPGVRFEHSIVLDAWRHSGQLHWAKVRQDKYPWNEMELPSQSPP